MGLCFFVALPISYTWSDVNIIDSTVEATNISPRFGYLMDVGDRGTFAPYVGATWLKADVDLTGSVTFNIPGDDVPELGDSVTID